MGRLFRLVGTLCLSLGVLAAPALAAGPADGWKPTGVSGVTTYQDASGTIRRAQVIYTARDATTGLSRTIERAVNISPASARAAARQAMRYAGPVGVAISVGLAAHDMVYDPETAGMDMSAGEWLVDRVTTPAQTFGLCNSGNIWECDPVTWGTAPRECWTQGACIVQGQGAFPNIAIAWLKPNGPWPSPNSAIEAMQISRCSNAGGLNVFSAPYGARGCVIPVTPPLPTNITQWRALMTEEYVVAPYTYDPLYPMPATDSQVDSSLDDQITRRLISEAIASAYSTVIPEIWDMANTLNDLLTESSANYDETLDSQTRTGESVINVGSQPESGGGGGGVSGEWPGFCSWATIVCSFIEWFQTDASPPDDPEVPVVEVTEWNEVEVGGGSYSCPGVTNLGTVFGEPLNFNWTMACDFVIAAKPIILISSLITSLLILVGWRGAS